MKKIIALLLSLLLMFAITACGDNDKEKSKTAQKDIPNETVLVLGIRKNNRAIPVSVLNEPVYNACYSYGSCSTVITEGEPQLLSNHILEKPTANILDAKRRQLAEDNTKNIINEISTLKASTPEVDILEAIRVASDSLNSINGECQKSIIIVDNGLSTQGIINFIEKPYIIDVKPEHIVEQLETVHALPNLTGVKVQWFGLGQTAGEQNNVSTSYKYKLESLWRTILEASGASVDFPTTQLPKKEASIELPSVSVVPIVEDHIDIDPTNIPETTKFDEDSSVKFKGDQAVFIDPIAAEKELTPIAKYLISTKERIYIVGLTATHGDARQREQLSLERSEACKSVLIKLGVLPEQLITVGLGYSHNVLREDDIDASGNLIEELAAKNRAVYFIKPTSSLVEILGLPNI